MPPPPKTFSTPQAVVASTILRDDPHQDAVVACNDSLIVAEAFAGSGKTTMAIRYAAARPSSSILYICFGKANQLNAAARFSKNTECRTGHSLAYGAVGHKFKISKSWKARDLASESNLDNRMAGMVVDTLGKFFSSTQLTPSIEHVAEIADKWDLKPSELGAVLSQSKFIWSKLQMPSTGMSMPPDGYLKLWALSKPNLSKYSHIILDEAQDTNPVMIEVVQRQNHATRLIVGDRHQSIYLFRGAVNAMEQFAASGATVLKMPKSYRFGTEIAAKASAVLSFFKGEDTAIIGAGPSGAQQIGGKKAVLARTNAGVLEAAAEVLGRGTHWVGGIESYRIEMMLDSFLLKSNKHSQIRDPYFAKFQSWDEYVEQVESTKDAEGRMLISMNEKYGKDIPYLTTCFRQNALPTEAGAKLVLSTVHRAKGLDFDSVVIADDFDATGKALDEFRLLPNEPLSPGMAQEMNLLYVAITRAKQSLKLNAATADFMKKLPTYRNEIAELSAKHLALDAHKNEAAEQVCTP